MENKETRGQLTPDAEEFAERAEEARQLARLHIGQDNSLDRKSDKALAPRRQNSYQHRRMMLVMF